MALRSGEHGGFLSPQRDLSLHYSDLSIISKKMAMKLKTNQAGEFYRDLKKKKAKKLLTG